MHCRKVESALKLIVSIDSKLIIGHATSVGDRKLQDKIIKSNKPSASKGHYPPSLRFVSQICRTYDSSHSRENM